MDPVVKTALDLISRPEVEGIVLKPYLCEAGYWTIGIGSRFLANGQPVRETTPSITRQQAYDLASGTLTTLYRRIQSLVTVDLTINQAAALLSFTYNEGPTAFADSTMLRLLNTGDYHGAALQFPIWNKVRVHGVLIISAGLVRRRALEMSVFNRPVTPAMV